MAEDKDLSIKMRDGIAKVLSAPYSHTKAFEIAQKIRAKADYAYHNSSEPLISDNEYDKLVDWIEKAGQAQTKSTAKIGSVVPKASPFAKVKHPAPIASLNKSKDAEELKQYFAQQFSEAMGLLGKVQPNLVVMPKLDGLTIVLRYDGGKLTQAVTRGDGEIGEDVTHTALKIKNIPHQLSHPALQGTVFLRGEAVISKPNFAPHAAEFKNPRNLVVGVIRTKDAEKTSKFKVDYILFNCIREESTATSESGDLDEVFGYSFANMLKVFGAEGFTAVDHSVCLVGDLPKTIQTLSEGVADYSIQLDGLVMQMDDLRVVANREASRTGVSKNPKSARAFKWQDVEHRTKVAGVIWSVARTGTITPVIALEPVEIEGTMVKQASVHNISLMRGLQLGIGDEVSVFKANMIIPQIAENFTKSNSIIIPKECPVCKGATRIRKSDTATFLECTNSYCPVKNTKSLDHFGQVMDIIGLGGKTIEALVGTAPPILTDFASIYQLKNHGQRCRDEAGLGPKIYSNLVDAIEKTRGARLDKVLVAFGIPGLGLGTSQRICKAINNDPERFLRLQIGELVKIQDIGPKTAESIYTYIAGNQHSLRAAFGEIYKAGVKPVVKSAPVGGSKLNGKSFACTGSLETFKNRKELEELIEQNGGVNSSVKAGLTYLINNDNMSQSAKNKKAIQLGIKVITEQEFLGLLGR